MAAFEKASELFNKIAREYDKQLKDASYQFQASVMAATHEMERMIMEWQKEIGDAEPEISDVDEDSS